MKLPQVPSATPCQLPHNTHNNTNARTWPPDPATSRTSPEVDPAVKMTFAPIAVLVMAISPVVAVTETPVIPVMARGTAAGVSTMPLWMRTPLVSASTTLPVLPTVWHERDARGDTAQCDPPFDGNRQILGPYRRTQLSQNTNSKKQKQRFPFVLVSVRVSVYKLANEREAGKRETKRKKYEVGAVAGQVFISVGSVKRKLDIARNLDLRTRRGNEKQSLRNTCATHSKPDKTWPPVPGTSRTSPEVVPAVKTMLEVVAVLVNARSPAVEVSDTPLRPVISSDVAAAVVSLPPWIRTALPAPAERTTLPPEAMVWVTNVGSEQAKRNLKVNPKSHAFSIKK